MRKVKVRLKENSYDIIIGSGILKQTGTIVRSLKLGDKALIVTNSYIRKIYGQALTKSLKKAKIDCQFFEVPDTEKSKSVSVAFKLINEIAQGREDKKKFIIAFGGGVIGDLAGFMAAVYKRGIDYIHVPTTFLAQIDSAIGGKVAVDLPVGKNLVGAFYQPRAVVSDVSVLSTLSPRQIKNGLAEAVKYGVIKDKKLFDYIDKNAARILNLNLVCLEKIVVECSCIKAVVVAADEKEKKGIRTILNFGHTLGHAIETVCAYNKYQHGEAVAIGMLAAADIAHGMGLFSGKNCLRLEYLIKKLGLPTVAKGVKLSQTLNIMSHDKKFKAGRNRFVLPVQIGKVKVFEGIPLSLIKRCAKIRM